MGFFVFLLLIFYLLQEMTFVISNAVLLLKTYEKRIQRFKQSVALVLHICIKQTFLVIYFVCRPSDLFYCNGLCRFRSLQNSLFFSERS